MKFELKTHFQIESARFLPYLPEAHPCRRMHGHSFKISLTLQNTLVDKLGWVMDYNEITLKMHPILAQLDHRVLNEVPGLANPTSELLAQWIYNQAHSVIPGLKQVSVAETPQTECSYPAL